MDKWKAEVGRVREEKRRRKTYQKRESLRRKKIQVREKVWKLRNTVFFPMIWGSEGSESRLAKAAGAEPAGQMRWKIARRCGAKHISKSKCAKHTRFRPLLEVAMSKKCTPLWREAHFQVKSVKNEGLRLLLEVQLLKKCTVLWRKAHFEVKMYKAHHSRSTFGSWDVENVHAVVVRSTFRSQNVQNTPGSDMFGPLLEVEMSKKCEAHFEVKSAKNWWVRSTFWRSDVVSRGRRTGLCILSKVSKTWGFCSISKNDGKAWTCEEDMPRCISRGSRSTRDMFIRAVRRSGCWLPGRGCIFEHQIFRFAEMILRDRCSTSYDPVSLFCGRRSSLERWSRKIAKRIGTRLSALHSTFHFWRTSRRIASFFDVVNLKN